MADFDIGLGDSPGLEFIDVNDFVLGSFLRPIVPFDERFVDLGVDLEWFAETPTGGGEFGEGPPDNARIRGTALLLGEVLAGAPPYETPEIDMGVALDEGFATDAAIDDPNVDVAAEVLGSTILEIDFHAEINASVVVEGDLVPIQFPELDPEVLVEQFGRRPCMPLLIHLDDVTHADNLLDGGQFRVNLYEAFLVADRYLPIGNDTLSPFGAQPNSIGMRVLADLNGDGTATEFTLFRRPLEDEVVVVKEGARILRWNQDEQVWRDFRTMPQRALDETEIFERFDPTGIYDYYAKILGLKYHQLQRDTARLLDFLDPNLCPLEHVPKLADNFGAPVSANLEEAEQREIIRNWIPLMQQKGLGDAIRIALGVLKYQGYGTHIWIRDGGDEADFIERPFSYNNDLPTADDAYYPSSSVAIHINNLDGSPLTVIGSDIKDTVATFLKQHILPAHVQIRTFVTDFPVAATADSITVTDGSEVFAQTHVAQVVAKAATATATISVSVNPIKLAMSVQAETATVAIDIEVIKP